MNVAASPHGGEKVRGCCLERVKKKKKIIPTSSPDPPHVLRVNNVMRLREEGGGEVWCRVGEFPPSASMMSEWECEATSNIRCVFRGERQQLQTGERSTEKMLGGGRGC